MPGGVWLFALLSGFACSAADPEALLAEARQSVRDPARRSETRRLAEEAYRLAQAASLRGTEAGALLLLGRLDVMDGATGSGVERTAQAYALYRALGRIAGQAESLSALGAALLSQYRYDAGIAAFEATLPLIAGSKDQALEARTLQNLGSAYWSKGDPEQALRYGQRALALYRALGDSFGIALGDQLLASVHWSEGDLQKAALQFDLANRRWQELKQPLYTANTHDGLGISYLAMGDEVRAAAEHEKALAIWTALKNGNGQAQSLNNLGMVAQRQQRYAEARNYLERAIEAGPGDARLQAYALHNLGHLQAVQGHPREAMVLFERSLEKSRSIGDAYSEGRSLYRLGAAQAQLRLPGAAEALEAALALQRRTRDRDAESLTLSELARVAARAGDRGRAKTLAAAALDIVESTRTSVASPDLRATYIDAHHGQYSVLVETLLEGNQAEAAFAVTERARARSLLDALAGWTPRMEGLDAQPLLARTLALERQLRTQAGALGQPSLPQAARGQAELRLEQTQRQYQEARSLLRGAGQPVALDPPEPWPVARIQKELLDPGTAMLSFWLGAETAYAWLLTAGSLRAVPLGPAARIRESGEQLYAALTAGTERIAEESLDARERRLNQANHAALRHAGELSRLLLRPFPELAHMRRLLVIADGVLHFVPFAMLPDPGRGGQALLAARAITVLPSASALGFIRERHPRTPQPWRAAAFADPAYSSAFAPLRHSRREVAEIPGVQLYLGAAADTGTFAAAARGPANLIHLGAHAIAEPAHPALSAIVLSDRDAGGRPRNGILRLPEIHELDVRAGLVVLSACRTAVGKQLRGEGVLSLTRAFLYGGAARVVATLWSVDDQATADLMQRFYRHLYGNRRSPAEALRAAQRELAAHPRWGQPRYWAAFQLQGEFR